MDRRHFIRVLGIGGIGVGVGCSSGMPPEAIEAWKGPPQTADLRRWLLGWAVLAPHSHNLQSWLVDLGTDDEIVLYCDRQRLLPETDPYSRQIMMSHGTFIELLAIAARERDRRAEVQLFPAGAFSAERVDDRPVARIRLVPAPGIARDPLFAQIRHRRTNRNAYESGRRIPAEAWNAMAAAAAGHAVQFGYADLESAQDLARHRAIAAEAWRIELTTPRTILESYRVLRVGAAEIAAHRDGLSMTDPMVVLLARLGLFDRSKPPAAEDYATRSQIRQFGDRLDSTPAFLWLRSDDNRRPTQVDAGRAYMRVQLAATAHGVAMQPLQQALQEYPEQAQARAAIHRLLGATAPQQTVQMWARVGYAPPVDPAPRRGVEAQIVRG